MPVYRTIEADGKRFIDMQAVEDAQAELRRLRESPIVAGFPITRHTNLRESGTHLGITWMIQNWGRYDYDFSTKPLEEIPGPGKWNYYLYINEHQLSADDWQDFWLEPDRHFDRSNGLTVPIYDYYARKWCSLDWHGGVTFYEKQADVDGNFRQVKIGCDFAHIWDKDRTYTFTTVQRECFTTIEQLCAAYRLKRRCNWSGAYDYPENGIMCGEQWYTTAGYAAWQAYREESAK